MAHPFFARLDRAEPLLYAVLDAGLCGPDHLVERGREMVAAGVDLLQVRAKDLGGGAFLDAVEALLPACRAAGVPLLVNDRVDVALAAGADGAHLGQEDLPLAEARRLLGEDALLGFSTHDRHEVLGTPPEADYLGYGALFPTSTRARSRVRGPATLTTDLADTTLPVFAIGGINAGNVAELGAYGLAGVAVAGALLTGPSVERAVAALRAGLGRWADSAPTGPS